MAKQVKSRCEGYHTITPYLTVEGASDVVDFLKSVFGAEERDRLLYPDGGIAHTEIEIGDSVIMLSDARGPCKPSLGNLYIYVEDVDATYKKAIEAGATSIMEPTDQFYGNRDSAVRDTGGNVWLIATHIEDVSPEEMRKRMQQMSQQPAGATKE